MTHVITPSPAVSSSSSPVSRRRTLARFGCVDFPVHDPRWTHSGEGGMFVKLVVVDERDYDQSDWTICCGAGVTDVLNESWVGDDQAEQAKLELPAAKTAQEHLSLMQEHDRAHRSWLERLFPRAADSSEQSLERYLSRSLLASVVLGNTGWSGYDHEAQQYWHCRFDDLTPQGKALYAQLQQLYPGCRLHLLTFLDT